MTGRTVSRWARIYVDGYDLSGYARSLSPLVWQYDEADLTAIGDNVKGYLPGQVNLGIGTINANLDNTAGGSHAVLTPGVARSVMLPLGSRALPAAGDPVYMGRFQQASYQASEDGGAAIVNVQFDDYDAAGQIAYSKPWGWLLHASGAETAANTATGIDDNGAASTSGGYLMYQVFAGNGTATIKIQGAATNSNASFADISGATSGAIDCSTPSAGMVQLATTATVQRYLRWQIALGTASTVTFALAFVRA